MLAAPLQQKPRQKLAGLFVAAAVIAPR